MVLSVLGAPSLGVSLVIQVPSVGNHKFEVVVVGDRCAHVIVVFLELFQVDLSIFAAGVVHRVVELEGVQEFGENFLLGLLA